MGLLDDAIREHLELKRRRGADAGEISREESDALGGVRRLPDGTPDLTSIAASAPPAPAADPSWDDDETSVHVPPVPAPPGDVPPPVAYEPPPVPASPMSHEPPPVSHDPLPASYAPPPVVHNELEPPRSFEPLLPPAAAGLPPSAPPPAERTPGSLTGRHATPGERTPEPPQPAPREKSRLRGGASRLRLRKRGEPPAVPPPPDYDDDFPPPIAAHDERPAYEPPPATYQPPQGDHDVVAPDDAPDDVLEETPEFLEETPDHDRLWFEQRPPRDFDFDK